MHPALTHQFHSELRDPRMIEVMGVLMGIDLQAFSRPEGASNDGFPPQANSLSTSTPEPKQPAASTSSSTASRSATVEDDVHMADAPEEEDPEIQEEKKARMESEQQKKIGSEAYKRRDFETAATAFEKAWELWPKDITFLTNLSGE